jgi:hypothetical protein
MSLKDAAGYRTFHRDISGNLDVTTTTDDTTLVTAKNANSTIYIQRIIGYVNTDAAQSISFEDSNGTAKKISKITTSPGADTRWDFDFGDEGEPLTEGKNFVMNVSAVGLEVKVKWYGYTKITSAMAVGSTN